MNAFLSVVLSNMVIACCLALFALCLTKVWRNSHLAHALWLMVLVKLVTPPIIGIPLPQFDQVAKETNLLPNSSWTTSDLLRRVGDRAAPPGDRPAQESSSLSVPNGEPIRPVPRAAVWKSVASEWPLLVVVCWFIGSLSFLGIAWRRHQQLLQVVATAGKPDSALVEDANGIAQRMGLGATPSLRITDVCVSPLVTIGAWNQTVLLPANLLRELNREQVRSILAHEFAHVRQTGPLDSRLRSDCRRNLLVESTRMVCQPTIATRGGRVLRRESSNCNAK